MSLSLSAHPKRADLQSAGSREKLSVASSTRTVSKKSRKCNLCAEDFLTGSVFDRYCPTCKQESELLKFSEWLPVIDGELSQKISA
jgi:hypothetical protein